MMLLIISLSTSYPYYGVLRTTVLLYYCTKLRTVKVRSMLHDNAYYSCQRSQQRNKNRQIRKDRSDQFNYQQEKQIQSLKKKKKKK